MLMGFTFGPLKSSHVDLSNTQFHLSVLEALNVIFLPVSFIIPFSCPPSLPPSSGEAAGYQRVLQVDLEVNGLLVPLGSRVVSWQVEYPLSHSLTDEVQTLIRLAPQDMGGIVPLAMVSGERERVN